MAQPALGIVGLTASHILEWAGVRPDMAGGHSYGELVALAAAGSLTPDALLDLSARRAESILDSLGEDPGAMAAVTAAPAEVERALTEAGLRDRVVAANRNGPRQTIVSGPTALVDEAMDHLRSAGHHVRRLPVACAFHSPLVAGAGERFAPVLARHTVRAPEFPVWANRTAAVYPARPDGVRAELAAQIGSPVRFAEQVEAMYTAGARIFVEAGPGTVLTGLVGQILGDRPHLAVACEPRPGAGLRGLLESLARLAVAGVPVRAGRLLQGRGAVTARPEPPGWTVDGQLVRTRSGDLLPGALQPARRVSLETSTVTRDSDAQHELIADFLRTTRELVAAQRDVLLTHLGATGAAASPPPVPPRTDAAPQAVPLAVSPAASEEAPPAEAPRPVVVDIEQAVLTVISERTGYPADMIEPDLDLEADLSIDSIKRTEIVGELARHLAGTRTFDDAEMEELSRARTVAAITAWIAGKEPPELMPEPKSEPKPEPATAEPEPVHGVAPRRFLLEETPLDLPPTLPDASLHGRRFALLGGGATAEELAARLVDRGAEAVAYDTDRRLDPADGPLDGIFHLGAVVPAAPSDGGGALLPGAFEVFRAALRLAPRWLICGRTAPGAGEDAGAGLHGLFRTIGREYGDIAARVVDLDPAATAGQRADFLLAELCAEDRAPVVVRTAAGRYGYALVERGLGGLARTGAGPAGDGAAEAAALGLDRDSVVVLAGGARGITADFALALAAASHCRIELLGRTPLPSAPEDPELAGAADAAALRALLAARGDLAPAAIEREVRNVLAGREVAHTLDRLGRLGSPAAYRVADMCDGGAVAQAVKEIQAEHGRIDVVVYAAGVIEDRLIEEKDPESFRRVYATKVDGARALLDAASQLPHGPRTAVLFGSVSAVLGNRGQCDYAAANDALAGLGERWARRTGRRALTVHWGPWAPSAVHGGMVTPHLAREYARRGVALIDREEGRSPCCGSWPGATSRPRPSSTRHRVGEMTDDRQTVGERQVPVAIVGMAVLLPGAKDLDAYWRNLVDGVDAVREVPEGRWDPVYYRPGDPGGAADRIYCRRGGFVDGLAEVDAARFGIMPSSVAGTEPDQLIALSVAARAIADAGGEERLPERGRVGVVLGRGGYLNPGLVRLDQRVRTAHQLTHTLGELLPHLAQDQLDRVRAAFTETLGPEHPESAIGLVPNLAASRIANRLDLRGPAYTVDAACASSLIAVDQAVGELASGRCDLMLAGGVHHCHDITLWSVFAQLRALSPSQRSRPFHAAADGILIGEGTGVVALKRLADAERDGDRVYAVIRGTGVAGDGRAAGLMNPDPGGQTRAVRHAWRAAGLDPRDPGSLGLLEAHGTGTPAGDAAELATLAEVFGPGVEGAAAPVIGSVKSMIGHCMPAAGVAGLVKAALAVHHATLLPTLHCEDPHPALARTRFRPAAVARPWEGPLRRAAVNAFGFGGINAHVVLEQAPGAVPAPRRAAVREPERVLRLSADTAEGLARLLDADDATVRERGAAPYPQDTRGTPPPGSASSIRPPSGWRSPVGRWPRAARGAAAATCGSPRARCSGRRAGARWRSSSPVWRPSSRPGWTRWPSTTGCGCRAVRTPRRPMSPGTGSASCASAGSSTKPCACSASGPTGSPDTASGSGRR